MVGFVMRSIADVCATTACLPQTCASWLVHGIAMSRSVLSTFPNVAGLKDRLIQILPFERLLQQLWWLQDVFFCQYPRAPMDAECTLALCVYENVDAVVWIRMPGSVSSSRNILQLTHIGLMMYLGS